MKMTPIAPPEVQEPLARRARPAIRADDRAVTSSASEQRGRPDDEVDQGGDRGSPAAARTRPLRPCCTAISAPASTTRRAAAAARGLAASPGPRARPRPGRAPPRPRAARRAAGPRRARARAVDQQAPLVCPATMPTVSRATPTTGARRAPTATSVAPPRPPAMPPAAGSRTGRRRRRRRAVAGRGGDQHQAGAERHERREQRVVERHAELAVDPALQRDERAGHDRREQRGRRAVAVAGAVPGALLDDLADRQLEDVAGAGRLAAPG